MLLFINKVLFFLKCHQFYKKVFCSQCFWKITTFFPLLEAQNVKILRRFVLKNLICLFVCLFSIPQTLDSYNYVWLFCLLGFFPYQNTQCTESNLSLSSIFTRALYALYSKRYRSHLYMSCFYYKKYSLLPI